LVKIVWFNRATNCYDTDGKFIIKFLLTDFEKYLQSYQDYLVTNAKIGNEWTLDDIYEYKNKYKNKIKELNDIFLDKGFHDMLVYYMCILS
jgi:hypothetical protein